MMMNYIQKESSLQRRINASKNVNNTLEKEIAKVSSETKSVICYIKRQIQIIYHLLDKTLQSWWSTVPDDTRVARLGSPAFKETDFRPSYQSMKSSLTTFFRSEISKMATMVKDTRVMNEIRSLGQDLCEKKMDTKINYVGIHIQQENINQIRNDLRYWLLVMTNLKNKQITTLNTLRSNINNLTRLYIPVYITSGGYKKYYLFDLMPLIINGSYQSFFGLSPPQWLDYNDLSKEKMTRTNPGIVILTNSDKDISSPNNWKAISAEFFDGIIDKVSSFDDTKKMSLIRHAVYLLLFEKDIYNSSATKSELLGLNESGNMRGLLKKYTEYSDTMKDEKSKHLIYISREFIESELKNAIIQYKKL